MRGIFLSFVLFVVLAVCTQVVVDGWRRCRASHTYNFCVAALTR